jgi:hypothetical protein
VPTPPGTGQKKSWTVEIEVLEVVVGDDDDDIGFEVEQARADVGHAPTNPVDLIVVFGLGQREELGSVRDRGARDDPASGGTR